MREITLHKRTSGASGSISCIDLFAGAGGLAVGFRLAGWSVLAANDADTSAGETFRLNFPETSFFEGPVSALTVAELLDECGLDSGQLDCLIGGPPCQSFSYNNHQRSADDARARLFEDYLDLVEGIQPKTLLMENVPGILTIDDGAVIDEIRERLTKLNYDCAIEIINAEEFGTPQSRRRVFIAGSRIGPAEDMIPLPTHWRAGLRVVRKGKVISRPAQATRRTANVWQAIGDLPELGNGEGEHVSPRTEINSTTVYQREIRNGARKLFNHACNRLTDVNLNRLPHIPEGGNWRDIPRDLLPAGMKRAELSDHTKRYGRLAKKGMASTILTKCDPHWGAYIHPTQDRTISVREAARLQGFPDSFQFAGEHLTPQYVQVGNAVPVPVAKALGKAVLNHVKKHKPQLVKESAFTPDDRAHSSRRKAA